MLASIIVLTYNNEQFIAEAMASALSQTYRPLEVVVTDDRSGDRTVDIAREIAKTAPDDVHVIINQNLSNLGIAGNFAQGVNISNGQVLIGMAGDDISEPDRATNLVNAFGPNVYAVGSPFSIISDVGAFLQKKAGATYPTTAVDTITTSLRGAAAAYRRDVFARFPAIPKGLMNEDLVFPLRAAMLGTLAFCNRPLVRHRLHENSFSQRSLRPKSTDLKRSTLSMRLVRETQANDINHAFARGLITAEVKRELLFVVDPLKAMAQLEWVTTSKRTRIIPEAFAAVRANNSVRTVLRSLVKNAAPGVWTSYASWRDRRKQSDTDSGGGS